MAQTLGLSPVRGYCRRSLKTIEECAPDGTYECYPHEARQLPLYDAVVAAMPDYDESDPANEPIERLFGLAAIHTAKIRGQDGNQKITIRWHQHYAYIYVCLLAERLGVPGAEEFARACREGG